MTTDLEQMVSQNVKYDNGLDIFNIVEELKKFTEILGKIFDAMGKAIGWVLHPIETLTYVFEWVLGLIPAILCVMILFYAVTASPKILRVMAFLILAYFLIRAAIAYSLVPLILVVVLAILIIRLLGVVM